MRCLCCCRCSCSSRSSTVRTHIRPSSYRDVAQLVVGAGARSGLGGGGAQRRGRGRWRCAALRGAVVVSSHFVARSDFFVTMSVAWPVGCQTATKPCPLSHVHTHCLCLSVSSSFFLSMCHSLETTNLDEKWRDARRFQDARGGRNGRYSLSGVRESKRGMRCEVSKSVTQSK